MSKIWRSNARPYIDPDRGVVFPFSEGEAREMDAVVCGGEYWVQMEKIKGDDYDVLVAMAVSTGRAK